MHISEGILPLWWAGIWSALAAPFLIKGIFDIKKKVKLTPSFKPLLGLMGALVFVISCMPVPVPTAGTCSHPAGTGISAILIGPIMSIFVTSIALLIQALFLAHGGLTTWGADIVSMGIAGSFAAFIAFKILRKFKLPLFFCGFAAGLLADWATYITTSLELASALHGSKPMLALFYTVLIAFIPTQLPLGILEGFLTGGMIVFVYKRRPEILVSLGVVKKSIGVLFICLLLCANSQPAFALNLNRRGHFPRIGDTFQQVVNASRKVSPQDSKESAPASIAVLSSRALSPNRRGHFPSALSRSPEKESVPYDIPYDRVLLLVELLPKWSGVDESVVEKISAEHGRPAWTPFINTDQGDLLLFVFLLAGAAGGFVMGYNFRKLFTEKKGHNC